MLRDASLQCQVIVIFARIWFKLVLSNLWSQELKQDINYMTWSTPTLLILLGKVGLIVLTTAAKSCPFLQGSVSKRKTISNRCIKKKCSVEGSVVPASVESRLKVKVIICPWVLGYMIRRICITNEPCHEKNYLWHVQTIKVQIAFVVCCLDNIIPIFAIAKIGRL